MSDETRQGVNLDEAAMLEGARLAAIYIDVWERGFTAQECAQLAHHTILDLQAKPEDKYGQYIAAGLKTAFGQ